MIGKLLFGCTLAGAAATLVVFAACSSSSMGFTGGEIEASTSSGPGPCPQFQFPSTCPVPAPSWVTDVRPLVEKYCGQCHQTGSTAAARLNLSTYSDVYANRTKCWYQIYQCWMPNQDGSPPPMAYPTAAERQTMITWMDVCNAPDN
jgi:hypothetical protein